jgi:hypothetical protein
MRSSIVWFWSLESLVSSWQKIPNLMYIQWRWKAHVVFSVRGSFWRTSKFYRTSCSWQFLTYKQILPNFVFVAVSNVQANLTELRVRGSFWRTSKSYRTSCSWQFLTYKQILPNFVSVVLHVRYHRYTEQFARRRTGWDCWLFIHFITCRPIIEASQSEEWVLTVRTPVSWVRIPLEAWMFGYLSASFCVVLPCVGGALAATPPPPRNKSYQMSKKVRFSRRQVWRCLLGSALCNLVEIYRRFRGASCLHRQGDE